MAAHERRRGRKIREPRHGDKDGIYTFDEHAANRACDFIHAFCVHSKGEWAGKPFEMQPWQRRIVRSAFGWMRPDGTRRYRTLYIEVPRKNGKSTFAAAIALYLQLADDEAGAEIYSAAADKAQARIVFDEAKRMVDASSYLSELCEVFKSSIFDRATLSKYEVLSSDAPTKHGLNPHGVVIDEAHALPDRELYDVLTTGMGARRQPMTVIITTAGYDRHSICWELHDYAIKIRDGIIEDPSFLAEIFAAAEDDDWHSEEVWAKANPNLGVSVKLDFLRDEHKRACETPGRENAFKRLYLNIWTEQATRWLSIEVWDRGATPVEADKLTNRKCWCGLDLSNTRDLSAFLAVFPDPDRQHFDVLAKFWVPQENVARRAKQDRVPYPQWIKSGLITATPGDCIDYNQIRADICEFARHFEVSEIAFDPWNAKQLCTAMMNDDGLNMVEFRQGFNTMTDPTKRLETELLKGSIRHGGNAVLRWMASNVVVEQDHAGNLKPTKKKSQERIDGIVALIMALGRAVIADGGSVYDERGLIVL